MSDRLPIDLSLVPSPDAIEVLDFETILAETRADYVTRNPEFSADTLESDPVIKLLETTTYRELLVRQKVNDGVRAVMLAEGTGADLDGIAARYNIERQVTDAGDPDALPPVLPTYETDARFRFRTQLAFEGLSTAGPIGGYIFHTVAADTRIPVVNGSAGVSVTSPNPAEVLVTIMSTEGDGVPDQDLLDVVTAALQDGEVRPLTDQVTVAAATKLEYAVTGTLEIYDGPDKAVVIG